MSTDLVRRVAAANPRTVVVVGTGTAVRLPWLELVPAVLVSWFGGPECGRALADVLLGYAEPGGRLPVTWPAVDPGPDGGYRSWQSTGRTPAHWFGHGLGYARWSYEGLTVDGTRVTALLRNTGERWGREVVQLYLSPGRADPDRPARWLAGFTVVTASSGELAEAVVTLPERAFEVRGRVEQGTYFVTAGRGVADRRRSTRLTLP